MTRQSLAFMRPDLAAEADGWDPATVSPGSSKILGWIDGAGHRWSARVSSRALDGRGCPFCSGTRAIPGETDLATTHPELASQAHGFDPTVVKGHSNRLVGWICERGHVWRATPNNRCKGTGCPICSGRQVLAGFNDLATLHPDVARDADGWDPSTVTPGSRQRMAWRCARGHRWEVAVSDRVSTQGCAVCSGWRVLAGFNDLASTHPELAIQAEGWDPSTVSAGSSKVVGWRCGEGHVWRSRVSHRVGGTGCPTCANKIVSAGFNDLATTHPALAAEADGWDPTRISAGSGKSLGWRCDVGHMWSARVGSRAGEGIGCPVCAGRKVIPGVNDLATTHPALAAEALGWDPTTLVAGSNLRRRWHCAYGHEWDALLFSRSRDGRGCPYCARHWVTPGVNDLATLFPEIARELLDEDPSAIHAGSHRRLTWQCENGHVWPAQVSSRTAKSNPSGCPGCAPRGGFDVTQPGYLYLVEHEPWGLLQIGISNHPKGRLSLHQSRGWVALDLVGPMDGVLTRAWEHDILHLLRSVGADVANAKVAGTFDGYTESWVRASHPAVHLRELMAEVNANDE